MKRNRHISLWLCIGILSILLSACKRDHKPKAPENNRTILVYINGNNNLARFADANIDAMRQAVAANELKGNIIILWDKPKHSKYFDPQGKEPFETVDETVLLKLSSKGRSSSSEDRCDVEILKKYGEVNASSSDFLRKVIDDTKRLAPAPSYGLIFWGHAISWLPENYRGEGALRVEGRPGEVYGGDSYNREWLDTKELEDVIHDQEFSFIWYDACYMGAIEEAYLLRNKCKYFVGYANEVISYGLPYNKVIPYLFSKGDPDLVSAAKHFMDFYRKTEYISYGTKFHSGCITVLASDKLDELAYETRSIINGPMESMYTINPKGIQPLEHLTPNIHALYDFGHLIREKARMDGKDTSAFTNALEKAVIYTDNTDVFYYANGGRLIGIQTFSGLSTYLPQKKLYRLNKEYKKTAWYRAVYQD